MSNVMAALPNIGAALCSTPQSLADAQYWNAVQYRCQDKTQNPLKFAGVPQTRQQISAASGLKSPYYEDMWRRYCCLVVFVIK